jgi:hypothetical protein
MVSNHPPGFWPPTNWAIVAGKTIMDDAKIGGITPEVLILRGR